MNRLNPIYLLLFSFCLFSYSIFDLKSSNDNLTEIQEKNKEFIKIATQYSSLQKAWGSEKNTKKICEDILKISGIRDVKIITNTKTIKIIIKNASLKSLDKFMNKLLNETVVILNFSLTKNSLDLEVSL